MIGAVSAASDANDTLSSDVSDEPVRHTDIDKTSSNNNNNNDNKDIIENKEPMKLKSTSTDTVSNKETRNNDKVSSTAKNDVLTSTGTPDDGKLTTLKDKINNAGEEAIIELNNSYTYNEEFSTIIITNNRKITIHGNGYTINANGKRPIFNVYAATLILENLKLINCNTTDGGAIGVSHSNLTITNCTFNNNIGRDSGAILAVNCILTITNCTFNSNIATHAYSGAISLQSVCNLNVYNTLFYNNEYGIFYNAGSVTIRRSAFIGDSYDDEGMDLDDFSKTSYTDGTFTTLQARVNIGDPNVILDLNTDYTRQDGESDIIINKHVTINGNGHTINANQKGRIFKITNTGNLTLTNITITGGQTTNLGENGGAIYNEGNLTIIHSTITDNNILADVNWMDAYGGAIYNAGNLTIMHSTITDNNIYITAETGGFYSGGGAIANHYGANLNINNSNITNNKILGNPVATYGGAIEANHGSQVHINNSQFNNNIAESEDSGGGAIYASDSQLYVTNTVFTKNIAKSQGGAINADHHSYVVVNGSLFVDNAANFGNAIHGDSLDSLTVNHNIFLNHTGTTIYLEHVSDYNFDYNWFGNNATNYNTPNNVVNGLTLTNWLFLKATNTTDQLNVFNTSNITFKLCLYNSTNTDNEVSDYDNTQLYPINLNITSSKGTVDKKTAGLNETIKYNATEVGKGIVTASIGTISCTIELTNNEIPTEIRVNNNTLDLKVGDTFTLIPTTTPEDLDVTFVQDDSGVYIVDENGVVTALKNGTGSILVKVGGDGVYAKNSTTVSVTVSKIPTEINVDTEPINLTVNDKTKIDATLTPSEAGSPNYTSNDTNIITIDDNGNITAISQGSAIITISYKGDNKYEVAENKTILINVKLKESNINVDKTTINLTVDDKYSIIAIPTPEDLPVTYTTMDTNLIRLENNNITALDVGTAYINVSVGGDGVYKYTQVNLTINIAKKEFKSIITKLHIDEILFSGKNATITGQLIANGTGLSKQEIILQLSNVTDYEEHYATTDDNGKFNITIQPYVLGNVNLTAIYNGNTTNKYIYNKTSTTTITKINKIYYNITIGPIQTSYDYNTTITITGTVTSNYQPLDVDYVNVTLNNGAQESVKLNGGKFTYTFNGTIGGINNITVTCKDATNITQVFIKYPTTFTINNIPDFTEGSSINLTVTELNNYTGPVIIIIGTEIYNLDMVNGIGNLTITPKLSPGTYTATIKFNGDANYTEANATSNNFTINAKPVPPSPTPTPSPEPVSKQNTKILAKNKVYKPAKYKTYKVTVKNNKGKPVKNTKIKLKIGKKTYTRKTNKKGIATFKIPNKKTKKKSTKKSYKITATLNKNAKKDKLTLKMGSKKYNTKTNNNGKGTFKIKTTKKIRKYTITLKTTNGQAVQKQKVTLKVNKKTYKATTNNKGKATFKINNLNKKGKYKAKINYKGNNNYNKSNKNVKITIKE